jgi:hypothetical protein
MATPEPAATAPAPERFDSLEAMRADYATLLKDLPSENLSAAHAERLRAFLKKGAATGALLDNPTDRQAAQAMLDYWRATLYAESRGRTGALAAASAPAPRLAESVLAPFATDTVRGVARRAESAVAAMTPEELELTRRLLLRVVRLAADRRVFEPEPTTLKELEKLSPTPGQVKSLLGRLAGLGVIREEGGRYRLAYEALTRHWERLRLWLEQRLRFRDAAQYWDKHERNPSALIADALLDEAEAYHDRNKLEDEFVHFSRKRERRRTRTYRIWASVFAGLAVVSLACATVAVMFALAASRAADAAEEAAKLEKKAHDLAVMLQTKAEDAKKEAEKARDDLLLNQRLDRILQLARVAAQVATAEDAAEREIARLQWTNLRNNLKDYAPFTQFLKDDPVFQKNWDIVDGVVTKGTWKQDVRNPTLMMSQRLRKFLLESAGQDATAKLKELRRVTYRSYYTYASWVVEALRKKTILNALPLIRELRIFYYGQMTVVEDRLVENAEVQFMSKLERIEQTLENELDPKKRVTLENDIRNSWSKRRKEGVLETKEFNTAQLVHAGELVWKDLKPESRALIDRLTKAKARDDQLAELEKRLAELKHEMEEELGEKISLRSGQRPDPHSPTLASRAGWEKAAALNCPYKPDLLERPLWHRARDFPPTT